MFDPVSDAHILALSDNQELFAETLQRARTGDQAAFEVLYLRYKIPIWRCLIHFIGHRDVVSDLFQETFLRAWNTLPHTKKELQFEPWLKRIAANLAIDYLRREQKLLFSPLPEDELEELTHVVLSKSVNFEERVGELECLQLALAQLSPRSRTCVLLQDLWGFSQREIAQLLIISEKSVSAYISRGREQLRLIYSNLIHEAAGNERREGT